MYCVALAPNWLDKNSFKPISGSFSPTEIVGLNERGYNIYYYPNTISEDALQLLPKNYFLKGTDINVFEWVFIDCDLKEKIYRSKDEFLEVVADFPLEPTKIVDSGNGIHVYWKISDLDPMSFLKLNRRLARHFSTDIAVSCIKQLMRLPGTVNTKKEDNLLLCECLLETDNIYSCEDLSKVLPVLTKEDEEYCNKHYEDTYNPEKKAIKFEAKMPTKFYKLVRDNKEVKEIWAGNVEDRSASDYRLGHILFASGFTKEEAMSVLINTEKASTRGASHRYSYAFNIVDKVWSYEEASNKLELNLSATVKEILEKTNVVIEGIRFPCKTFFDGTHNGFRLGQVIGLVAGSGVGKTTLSLNMFMGFVENNPEYEHFFVPLEQQATDIAERWRTMCGENTALHNKVHILSNYDDNGTPRNLSIEDIENYIMIFQESTKKKVGCVVIDHIANLKRKNNNNENQGIIDICHSMKTFAVKTNTLLIMQSQSSREKAGIGDLELNKDAAYGSVHFEGYCDYLITTWQPLKRCYSEEGCMPITAFKFCKIRKKKLGKDRLLEDVCYYLYFDPTSELLRELTQEEEKSFIFWNNKAINKRKVDRKTGVIEYKSTRNAENKDN